MPRIANVTASQLTVAAGARPPEIARSSNVILTATRTTLTNTVVQASYGNTIIANSDYYLILTPEGSTSVNSVKQYDASNDSLVRTYTTTSLGISTLSFLGYYNNDVCFMGSGTTATFINLASGSSVGTMSGSYFLNPYSGNLYIVGNPNLSVSGLNNVGTATITNRVTGAVYGIPSPDVTQWNEFGGKVEMNDKWVVCGGPMLDKLGQNLGGFYYYKLADVLSGNTTPFGSILNNNSSYFQAFGMTIFLDGDYFYVSLSDGLRVYNLNTGQLDKTLPAIPNNSASFQTIKKVGDLLFIGNYNATISSQIQQGSISIYDLRKGTILQSVNNPSGTAYSNFGQTLAVVTTSTSGKAKLIVGAPYDDTSGTNTGRVYIYQLSSDWLTKGFTTPDRPRTVPVSITLGTFGPNEGIQIPKAAYISTLGSLIGTAQTFTFVAKNSSGSTIGTYAPGLSLSLGFADPTTYEGSGYGPYAFLGAYLPPTGWNGGAGLKSLIETSGTASLEVQWSGGGPFVINITPMP